MNEPRYPTDADEDEAAVAAEIEAERALRAVIGEGAEDGEHTHPEDMPDLDPDIG